jgi:hypothetical protein
MLLAPIRVFAAAAAAAAVSLQAAATPPDSWLWKNVYVDSTNTLLRTVEGTLVQPLYDPSYAN